MAKTDKDLNVDAAGYLLKMMAAGYTQREAIKLLVRAAVTLIITANKPTETLDVFLADITSELDYAVEQSRRLSQKPETGTVSWI